MPQREKPRVHMNRVCLSSTVTVDGVALIEAWFLSALRDAGVRSAVARYVNPVELPETTM